MTQLVRQKWLLLLACANAALALVVVAVVGFAAGGARRAEQEAATIREAHWSGLRAELGSLRGEIEGLRGLRAAVDDVRMAQLDHRPPQETQLAQAMQLIAAEQQLLLMKALRPAPVARRSSARRVRRPARTTCPVK